MKNIFTLILLFSIVLFAKAQTLPNSDFETWENLGLYEDPEYWNTANYLTSLLGAVSVTKSENAYSGTYCARLETIDIPGLTQAPGLLTLAEFSVNTGTFEYNFSGGYFLQENVSRLTGMYKYTGALDDSASIVIYNFKHPEGEEMDTIGVGMTFLHDTEDWTPFEVIMVNNNNHLPDSFNVIILSSGSTDMNVGSILFIDSLAIETNTGIIDLWNPVSPLHVYPNPAVETVNFEADAVASERELIIYDLNGRIVYKNEFNKKHLQLNIEAFETGVFSYSVIENGKRTHGGSFLKK